MDELLQLNSCEVFISRAATEPTEKEDNKNE